LCTTARGTKQQILSFAARGNYQSGANDVMLYLRSVATLKFTAVTFSFACLEASFQSDNCLVSDM